MDICCGSSKGMPKFCIAFELSLPNTNFASFKLFQNRSTQKMESLLWSHKMNMEMRFSLCK